MKPSSFLSLSLSVVFLLPRERVREYLHMKPKKEEERKNEKLAENPLKVQLPGGDASTLGHSAIIGFGFFFSWSVGESHIEAREWAMARGKARCPYIPSHAAFTPLAGGFCTSRDPFS